MRRFLLYGVFPLLLISQGCTMVTAVAPAGYDVVSHYGFAASGAYMTARGGYGEITIIRPVQGLGTYTQIKFQPSGKHCCGNPTDCHIPYAPYVLGPRSFLPVFGFPFGLLKNCKRLKAI